MTSACYAGIYHAVCFCDGISLHDCAAKDLHSSQSYLITYRLIFLHNWMRVFALLFYFVFIAVFAWLATV
jgi:hypothetical protein